MNKPLEGYHLLIAEDNPTNQIVVARIVEQLGASFDLASDGVEAIQVFDPKRHDLALLDIEMPKKSGLEVARFIRSRSDTPKEFPIVALTAFVLAEHRAKIRDAGADVILAKPIVDVQAFGNELVRQLDAKEEGAEVEAALTELEKNMGVEVMPELITSLRSDLVALSGRITKLKARDDEELASVAHSLVSLSRMAGDERFASKCQSLEASVSTLDDEGYKAAAGALNEEICDLLGFIDKFRKRYA